MKATTGTEDSESVIAFVAMGSNLGNREAQMLDGLNYVMQCPQVEMQQVSSLYETEPVGYLNQPLFLNAVVCLTTALSAPALLQLLLQTESHFGRERRLKWGPRTLDLDLLYYGETTLQTSQLTLPHPRMLERAFVLWPLLELKEYLSLRQQREVSEGTHRVGQQGICHYRDASWALARLS